VSIIEKYIENKSNVKLHLNAATIPYQNIHVGSPINASALLLVTCGYVTVDGTRFYKLLIKLLIIKPPFDRQFEVPVLQN
jgi:hypothetical protein